ncbi:SDR family oxidoreductase [Alphaproteobacteria bacterium]|nr:SDR family oxidoreductase [Alphaproteobacteria bacterium]MDA8625030.1 SDR family oxidoreductase [Alphaproteobacteria bacterium]MDA8667068.1 SDR family oxidoreductase [Alphaproteobacteria bacterium]MDA8779970.1 SDR family oxidoreductase [Alphaproteobacteria bacterium]MDA9591099.1 SDR family oxidoreductase [Alphaproteobacteria bacterium]
MNFSDQVAIITGSSSGIGEAAAIGIAEGGGKVVINYSKSADAAEKVVAACQAAGGDAIAVQADVSSDADCKALVDAALDKWGRLDILVNNAGTTKFMNHDDLEGLDAADFEQIYALNLIAPYQMIKQARPHLAKSDAPSIVNISSIAGVRGIGSSIAYVASKGALNSMTLALARSLGPENIRVNAVCPGFVGTDWFRNAFGDEVFEKIAEGQRQGTPMARAGSPQDTTGPILFFAGCSSAHVTGQLLVVDAGMLLGMPFKIG